jgi:hypothetical protein
MRTPIRSIALALLLATTLAPRAAQALTADQVLQLKQAGVSDATIQQMLENERVKEDQQHGNAPSAAMANQKFANDHIGSWTTSDGRVVLSTGRADPQRDMFDPTVPQNPNDYSQQMNVYPYVFPGAPMGGGPAPVLGPHGPIGGGMGPR